jgi:hypothetical protein
MRSIQIATVAQLWAEWHCRKSDKVTDVKRHFRRFEIGPNVAISSHSPVVAGFSWVGMWFFALEKQSVKNLDTGERFSHNYGHADGHASGTGGKFGSEIGSLTGPGCRL